VRMICEDCGTDTAPCNERGALFRGGRYLRTDLQRCLLSNAAHRLEILVKHIDPDAIWRMRAGLD
jgi:hypothetical protein